MCCQRGNARAPGVCCTSRAASCSLTCSRSTRWHMLAAQCDRQNMMDPVCCCPQAARRGTHESASSACRVRFTASSNPLLPRSRRRSHGRAIWLRTWSSAESSYRADVIPRVPSFVLRAVDTLPLLAGGLALLGGAGVFGQDQSLYLQGLLGIEVTLLHWPGHHTAHDAICLCSEHRTL